MVLWEVELDCEVSYEVRAILMAFLKVRVLSHQACLSHQDALCCLVMEEEVLQCRLSMTVPFVVISASITKMNFCSL